MPDNSEITRLAELLIGRQDQQQQQITLLAKKIDQTDAGVIRHAEMLARQQQQTALLLEQMAKTDAIIIRHDEMLVHQQQQTDSLLKQIAKTDALAETFGQVQTKLIDQLELIYNEQQRFNQNQEKFNDRQEKFNERQEKFNDRQDQFNIIFLDEIRGLKKDVKLLIEEVMQRHEERLKRLEDFMDGFMRQAG